VSVELVLTLLGAAAFGALWLEVGRLSRRVRELEAERGGSVPDADDVAF
jgi:hypothetical protein